jgi:acetolactate synthase-1/2/3 large subunit
MLKWAERIEHPAEAPYKMAQAFQAMRSGRPSPVALEMPWDQFSAVAEVAVQDPLPLVPLPPVDGEKVAALAKALGEAKAPLIWVGSGAIHAAAEIRALAEKLGAPVAAYRTGRGIVDSRHPLGLSVTEALKLWPSTDFILGFGTRMDTAMGRWGKPPAGLKSARVDIDPAEMRRLRVDIPIVGDSAVVARALVGAVTAKADAARAAQIAAARKAAWDEIQKVQPQMTWLKVIREVMPDDGILCDEMTQAGYVSWFGYPIHAPRTLITSGFSGTLGAGVPMALGVKVAHPDKPVVALTGDGGFLFGGAELATAMQHGINLVVVLFNNSSYGNVLRDQKRLYDGRDSGSALRNPDFQVYAKAFGVPSWRVTDGDGLRSALTAAIGANSPALIEVMTDISQEYMPWEFLAPTPRD